MIADVELIALVPFLFDLTMARPVGEAGISYRIKAGPSLKRAFSNELFHGQ